MRWTSSVRDIVKSSARTINGFFLETCIRVKEGGRRENTRVGSNNRRGNAPVRVRRYCAPETPLQLNTPSLSTADSPLLPSLTPREIRVLAISDAQPKCSEIKLFTCKNHLLVDKHTRCTSDRLDRRNPLINYYKLKFKKSVRPNKG